MSAQPSPDRAVQAKDTYRLPCVFHPKSKNGTCKNIQMSAQPSPDRAVQEKLLTRYHVIYIQDAKIAHAKRFKCQLIVP
eukprot:19730-Hanusia_phi.AAC.1